MILPGPGFKPVTSRVAGRRCPCILSHLTIGITLISEIELFDHPSVDVTHLEARIIPQAYIRSFTKNIMFKIVFIFVQFAFDYREKIEGKGKDVNLKQLA